MTLREHGAKPGPETAPAVKVAEERSSIAVAFLESEEIRVDRIGNVACAATGLERVCRAIQYGAVLEHKMIPG